MRVVPEPLYLPFSPADREHLPLEVASAWGGERGVASLAGVDGRIHEAVVDENGWLVRRGARGVSADRWPSVQGALVALAEHLEAKGYAVDWSGEGPRVVGWATVACPLCDGHRIFECDEVAFICKRCGARAEHQGRVRVVDLDRCDDLDRLALDVHEGHLWRAREARRGPGQGVDLKREHGIREARAQAASWRRAGR